MTLLAAKALLRRSTLGRARPGAFTLMELVLGMMVTTLIMSAVAALMTTVGRGWEQSISTQASSNTIFQMHMRLRHLLRGARQLGAVRVGSIDGTASEGAALLFWKSDTNQDGVIQYSEVALIEHQAAASADQCALVVYEVSYATEAEKAAYDNPADTEKTDWIFEKPNQPSPIEQFKQIPYVPRTPKKLVQYVTGCEFRKSDGASTVRPTLNYLVNIHKDGSGTETEYGTITVRQPAPLPTSQRGG